MYSLVIEHGISMIIVVFEYLRLLYKVKIPTGRNYANHISSFNNKQVTSGQHYLASIYVIYISLVFVKLRFYKL